MKNLLEQFNGQKKVIHCKTKEEYKRIKQIFKGLGFSFKNISFRLKEHTCLRFENKEVNFSNYNFYEKKGYEIIPSTEIQEENSKIKVIKVKSVEHGEKVIKYLETITNKKSHYCCGSVGTYYGICKNGNISKWEEVQVLGNNCFEIIEIMEFKEEKQLPIPRKVLVRDRDNEEWQPSTLYADLSYLGLEYPYVCFGEYHDYPMGFRQMKELPLPEMLTKEEAIKKLKEVTGEDFNII